MAIKKSEEESREGSSFSNRKSNENESQSESPKKKRLRVGDVRKQSMELGQNSSSRERNPYNKPNEGYRGSSSSYERREYNSGSSRSYENRDNNYNSSERRSYSSNRENNSYGNSYGNNNGNERRSYNNNNNNSRGSQYSNSRGSNDRRPSYGNNDRYNQRPSGRPADGIKRLVKPVKYKENIDPNTPIRLNKYLANAGVCSRREADTFITAGVVKVNGVVANELGIKVKRGDLVTFHDQPVRLESKVYVLLNKPKNTVTTSDDPENRKTVMDLVKGACPERIYPVGRLDRNTTGVLLLTNDGDLASKLTHPKFMKKKIYQVTLDREVAIEDMQAIADGIELEDGEIHADSIAYQSEDVLDVVGIEIHSGRNRVVRRIFEKLGYHVVKLDRVYFAGLTKKNVLRGKWRYLTEKEVNMLRMGAFE